MSGKRLFEAEDPPYRAAAWLAPGTPDIAVAAMALWFVLAPIHLWKPDHNALMFGVAADGATLMGAATLIDLASRLRRPPPWWIAPLLPLGLALMFPEVLGAFAAAAEIGWLVLLVFAWSMGERIRELWTLPLAPRLEKYRRRTLVFDRLYTGLVVGGGAVLFMACSYALFDIEVREWSDYALYLVTLFYAINAFNAWRVYRPAFAARPRSLWPFIDGGGIKDLSPL